MNHAKIRLEFTDPIGPFDEAPMWSPDGNYLVHVCWPDDGPSPSEGVGLFYDDTYRPIDKWLEICTTNVNSRERLRITQDKQANADPSWSPDSNSIVFVGGDSLFVTRADGSEVKNVTQDKHLIHDLYLPYTWSPGGEALCFAAQVPGDVGTLNTDLFLVDLSETKATLHQLTDRKGTELEPRWSPNGDQIAFIWSPEDIEKAVSQIHIIDVRNNYTEKRITALEGANYPQKPITDLSWSPDGKLLAFVGARDQFRSAIYLVNVDNLQRDQITAEMEILYGLSWSPGGSRIAFVGGGSQGDLDIFTVRSDGTGRKQITDRGDFDNVGSFYMTRGQRLSWSPDGQFLAFVRGGKREYEQRIWIVDAEGSESPQQVTGQ